MVCTMFLLALVACSKEDPEGLDGDGGRGAGDGGAKATGGSAAAGGSVGGMGGSDGGNSGTDCVATTTAMSLGDDISEFPLATANSSAAALTPATASIWFTQTDANMIGRSTFGGQMTEYAIATPGVDPRGISSGPDGAHWFIGTGQIGRITDAGAMTLFDLPAGGDGWGIGHGAPPAADYLWYTDNGRETIGQITTSGAITEFPVPYAGSVMRDLVLAPDEGIWFSDVGTNQIVHVTVDGTFTQFPIPTPNANPGALDRVDGTLWFTETAAGKLASLTLAGAFTEYDLPSACAEPVGIVGAPDGSIWYTERALNRVIRRNLDGTRSAFEIPTGSSAPAHISAKSNGTIWFLETDANNLAMIAPL